MVWSRRVHTKRSWSADLWYTNQNTNKNFPLIRLPRSHRGEVWCAQDFVNRDVWLTEQRLQKTFFRSFACSEAVCQRYYRSGPCWCADRVGAPTEALPARWTHAHQHPIRYILLLENTGISALGNEPRQRAIRSFEDFGSLYVHTVDTTVLDLARRYTGH